MIRLAAFLALVACHAPTAVRIAQAETSSPVTVLHTLTDADGTNVRGALTELDGRLYGLAGERGPNATPACSSTAAWSTIEHTAHCPGSLFSVNRDGSDFRVEHAFSRLDDQRRTNADGYHPYGTLAVGTDHWLYGVTQMGGSPGMEPGEAGYGVAFAYDPATGAFGVLHSFGSEPRVADGEYPMGALAVDSAGNVFGATKGGGLTNTGTVWEWSPGGAFRYAPLPGETYGGVTLSGGLLHGTTWAPRAGVYFTVDPVTLAVTVVAEFPAYTENEHGTDNTPIQSPLALSNGAVVTAREFGGAAGAGLLAALTPAGGIRVLHEASDIPLSAAPRFSNATGGMLNGQIVEGLDGLIYGTAQYGGAYGTGGIWRTTRDGSQWDLLWSWPDAAYPYGGLTLGSDGALYGVTYNTGQVFRFDPRAVGGCR